MSKNNKKSKKTRVYGVSLHQTPELEPPSLSESIEYPMTTEKPNLLRDQPKIEKREI